MYSSVNILTFVDWLQQEMDRRKWNQSDLAREAGLSRGAVGNVIRQEREPGKDFLTRIANAFEMPIGDVFQLAGFLPLEPDSDPLVNEAAHLVGLLPEDKKRLAVSILRTLVEDEEKMRGKK